MNRLLVFAYVLACIVGGWLLLNVDPISPQARLALPVTLGVIVLVVALMIPGNEV